MDPPNCLKVPTPSQIFWGHVPPHPEKVFTIISSSSNRHRYAAKIEVLKNRILRLGGHLIEGEEWDPRINHVVCLSDNREIRGTERLKAAIAAGI